LFSVYPTLTALCGIAPNPDLEARSLAPLLKNPKANWPHPTITTWGCNNHAIKTKDYRYIRYEDGSEELYFLKTDPNEWDNVANQPKYTKLKGQLKEQMPVTNAKWAAASKYNVNAYFIKQKNEQSEETPPH